MRAPDHGDEWLALTADPLDVGVAYDWCVRGDCGAVVLFSGTVRDHAVDDQGVLREGVGHLTYEAYEEQVVPKLAAIVAELRVRWPATGRVVLWHRIGRIELAESSVVVVVAAPHRPEAFAAGTVRDRRDQGVGADLEARAVAGRCRLGHRRAPTGGRLRGAHRRPERRPLSARHRPHRRRRGRDLRHVVRRLPQAAPGSGDRRLPQAHRRPVARVAARGPGPRPRAARRATTRRPGPA